MTVRRHGLESGFFDGVTTFNQSTNPGGGLTVPVGATSAIVEVGRSGDNFSFYVNVTNGGAPATQWWLQVAHTGTPDGQGNYPSPPGETYQWHDAYYLGTSAAGNSTKIYVDIPATGGAIMSFVPDFCAGWVRLRRSDANAGTVNVIAGYEIQGD